MDKDRCIAALRSSVEEFAQLREQDPASDWDLSGADLSGCNLQGVQLRGMTMHDVNFEGADLTGANLTHTKLQGARFKGARLVDINMHRVELEGADLRGAIIDGFDADSLICLNACMFNGVRWDKEQLEHFLSALNRSEDWEIRYEVVPRAK